MPEPEFLTPKEAAAILRVSTKTVLRWVRDGALPSRRIDGTVRISSVHVTGHVCAQCQYRSD